MSIDRSLKIKGALARHRNVLTRAERVGRLKDEERWQEEDSTPKHCTQASRRRRETS